MRAASHHLLDRWSRRSSTLALVVTVTAGVLLAAACSSDDEGDDGASATTVTRPTVTSTTGADGPTVAEQGPHACVPGDPAGVEIAWDELANPIVDLGYMTKDQTLRRVGDAWYLAFSERAGDTGAAPVGMLSSPDLLRWEPVEGSPTFGSPDLTRHPDGTYVMTFQVADADRPEDPDARRLAYRTAPHPGGPWSQARPLADDLFPDERLLDAAVAHTDHGTFLVFKRGAREGELQHTEIAHSPSGDLDGPWTHVGEADLAFTENYQLLPIDGTWHVLATRIPVHQPVLYELAGPADDPASWLRWEEVTALEIPEGSWNAGGPDGVDGVDHETANSAHLCDARALDGHWYLTYAGSTELDTFEGRGQAKIGIARSTDLRTWEVAGG